MLHSDTDINTMQAGAENKEQVSASLVTLLCHCSGSSTDRQHR